MRERYDPTADQFVCMHTGARRDVNPGERVERRVYSLPGDSASPFQDWLDVNLPFVAYAVLVSVMLLFSMLDAAGLLS